MRLTLLEVGLRHAEVAALRGTCDRLQVGCVITDARGVILSSGYNGALSGQPHCEHGPESTESCDVALHAEQNAILWAARRGVAIEGGHLYSTHSPCVRCASMIIQAGIQRVVFRTAFRDPYGLNLLSEALVTHVHIP